MGASADLADLVVVGGAEEGEVGDVGAVVVAAPPVDVVAFAPCERLGMSHIFRGGQYRSSQRSPGSWCKRPSKSRLSSAACSRALDST